MVKKTVFCNGCFDLLHVGHLSTIRYCRSLAGPDGKVIIGLNNDASVSLLKGPHRPVNSEQDRKEMLKSLTDVDEVIIFRSTIPYKLINILRPDIIVKGPEYKGLDVIGSDLAEVMIAPRYSWTSTTDIIRRMMQTI